VVEGESRVHVQAHPTGPVYTHRGTHSARAEATLQCKQEGRRTAGEVAVHDVARVQAGHAGREVERRAEHRRHARALARALGVNHEFASLDCGLRAQLPASGTRPACMQRVRTRQLH